MDRCDDGIATICSGHLDVQVEGSEGPPVGEEEPDMSFFHHCWMMSAAMASLSVPMHRRKSHWVANPIGEGHQQGCCGVAE